MRFRVPIIVVFVILKISFIISEDRQQVLGQLFGDTYYYWPIGRSTPLLRENITHSRRPFQMVGGRGLGGRVGGWENVEASEFHSQYVPPVYQNNDLEDYANRILQNTVMGDTGTRVDFSTYKGHSSGQHGSRNLVQTGPSHTFGPRNHFQHGASNSGSYGPPPPPSSSYGPPPSSSYGPPRPASYGPPLKPSYGLPAVPPPTSNHLPHDNGWSGYTESMPLEPQVGWLSDLYGPSHPHRPTTVCHKVPPCHPNCICVPNGSPASFDSYEQIPHGSIVTDGHDTPVTRDDLPPLIPNPPAHFIVGVRTPLPSNYTVFFSEQYDIRLTPEEVMKVQKSLYELDLPNGPRSRPPRSSSGRRHSTRDEPQELNSFRVITSATASPGVPAPLNGTHNSNNFFSTALDNKAKVFQNGPRREHPFVSQLDAVLDLFKKLGNLHTQQNAIDARNENRSSSLYGEDGSGSIIGSSSSDLATPIVFIMMQRFSVPEPDSGEGGMLDAAFNFGAQANRITFGDQDIITDGWRDAGSKDPMPLDLSTLGNSVDEAQATLNERVRDYLQVVRTFSSDTYDPVEELAYRSWQQYQYFIIPPSTTTQFGCQPIDPQLEFPVIPDQSKFGRVDVNKRPPPRF